MTKVSYNVISGLNNSIFTGIKSYPEAAAMAANLKGTVATVYTPYEVKDKTTAKFRLAATV